MKTEVRIMVLNACCLLKTLPQNVLMCRRYILINTSGFPFQTKITEFCKIRGIMTEKGMDDNFHFYTTCTYANR